MPIRGAESPVTASKKEILVREILERVADKWTLLVIDALDGEHEVRLRTIISVSRVPELLFKACPR